MANPTVEGKFVVADDGRELAMICWGEGSSPTVVLEAGHPSAGIQQFGTYGRAFVGELVGHTRVCAYDRAGNGRSDPAPDEPRDADDVVNDLHALLATANIDGPYVLVGASFGGFIVTYYAARFPVDVAAVVLLDVPAPSATLSLAEAPELAWDHPTNPEHVNVVPEFENRFARKRLPFEAPLTVITASEGQSSVEDQSIWLELSPQTTQVELQGGHNIYEDDPEGVAAEVIKLLEAVIGSATPSPEAVSPLEGTWRTGPISPRDVETTLRQFGLAQWIEPFRPVAPFGADTVLILEIGEEWDLYGMATGRPREEIDYDADYRVHGDKVDVVHSAGFNTFRWSVDGDTLTLEWLNTTIPSSDGIPEEVFQRALYMTEEFVMKG